MKSYLSYDGFLTRWAFLPELALRRGTPNRAPLWEFWMRCVFLTPVLVGLSGWVTYQIVRAAALHPWGAVKVGIGLWLFTLFVGALLKIKDRADENADEPRDFIYFE